MGLKVRLPLQAIALGWYLRRFAAASSVWFIIIHCCHKKSSPYAFRSGAASPLFATTVS